MRTRALKVQTRHTPQTLAASVRSAGGLLLLESAGPWASAGRRSFVAVDPLVVFQSRGACCEVTAGPDAYTVFGNPWRIIETIQDRFDLGPEGDLPFPTGFCAGFWGYELRQFVEPKLRPHPAGESEVPDCWLGWYDSLVVFDHDTGGAWVVSTGLEPDGSRSATRSERGLEFWGAVLEAGPGPGEAAAGVPPGGGVCVPDPAVFLAGVRAAQRLIRQGDVYQVNIARRWEAGEVDDAWGLYRRMSGCSPAPCAAFLGAGSFGIASTSPESFLRMDGPAVETRPIKGTRPRGEDAWSDAVLARELRASGKEAAELTMITDLLRNDLGRVCTFGSVRVPELARLEAFAQVQHLVSTVTGRLRSGVTHLRALESCFPGGSITGAPKFRAMQVIDELEPVARGPYTGCLGYLGFNRQSHLSIVIRSAVVRGGRARFHAGAGIVADSDPESELEETDFKARGFLRATAGAVGGGLEGVPGREDRPAA